MRQFSLLSLLFLLAQSGFGQMLYNYSSYTNRAVDANGNIVVTTVLSGSTTCRNFPPCLSAQHQGTVQVNVGKVSRMLQTAHVSPSTYISLSNAVTLINPIPGQDYPESDDSQVQCTFAGNVFGFQENPGPLLRINITNFILETWSPTTCFYLFWCPNGNTAASCPTSDLQAISPENGSPGCRGYNYLHTFDLMIGGVCTYTGEAEMANTPIDCD